MYFLRHSSFTAPAFRWRHSSSLVKLPGIVHKRIFKFLISSFAVSFWWILQIVWISCQLIASLNQKHLKRIVSIYFFEDLVARMRDDAAAGVLLLALLAPSDKMLSIVISKVYSLFLKSKVTYWKNFNINLPYGECTGLGYCNHWERWLWEGRYFAKNYVFTSLPLIPQTQWW